MPVELLEPVVKPVYDPHYETIDGRVENTPGLGSEMKEYGLLTKLREFVRPRPLIESKDGKYGANRDALEYHVDEAIRGDEKLTSRYERMAPEQRAHMRTGLGRAILEEYANRTGFEVKGETIESKVAVTAPGAMEYINKGLSLAGLGVLALSVATGGTVGIAAYLGTLGARLAAKLIYRASYGSGGFAQGAADVSTPLLSYAAPGVGEVIDLATTYRDEVVRDARAKGIERYLSTVPKREPLEVSEHMAGMEVDKILNGKKLGK